MNGQDFEGRAMKVYPYKERTMSDDSNTIFMGNLSFQIDDSNVREFFADVGEPTSIRWITSKETGQFKGCVTLC
jgi:nucleolin